jgi:hypothetical protein
VTGGFAPAGLLAGAPDYLGGSLADVLPSVAAWLGVPGFADRLGLGALGSQSTVVVCLVDGLGRLNLAANEHHAPFLASLPSAAPGLTCGLPSTTPTSLASLGTGLPPLLHGLVSGAFLLPETGKVLAPLRWKDDPNPIATQPEPTVFERVAAAGVRVANVGPRAYEKSGLTRAALRGCGHRGADTVGERVAGVAAELAGSPAGKQRSLIYVYLPELDKVGHVHGVDSLAWRTELAVADLLVARIAAQLPPTAALLVTADHGMVDVPDEARIDLEADEGFRSGVELIAGEPRLRMAYTKRGAQADAAAAWRELLAGRAVVMRRDEAVAAGWFGDPQDDGWLSERIGDVVAAATGNTALVSNQVDPRVSGLRGQHGSLTVAELAIPLLAYVG